MLWRYEESHSTRCITGNVTWQSHTLRLFSQSALNAKANAIRCSR